MTLLELQRRMEQDVRRPLTAELTMQLRTSEGESMEEIAATYIRANSELTSFERLEIYNRQYWLRVIGAVSEDYPALQALVGAESFDALVLEYLKQRPSSSWTLRDLSADLPQFLKRYPEFAGEQYQLAVDITRLEWVYVEAFDGAQIEPLASDELARLGPESALALQPHLRLLAVDYPVDEFVLAVKKLERKAVTSGAAQLRQTSITSTLPEMTPEQRYLAVHRYDDVVYYRTLEEGEFRLLEALRQGKTIAEAVDILAGAEQLTTVQQTFALAAELGWFCHPTL
ncbi:HvfC/BufC N-terminal domain-containing protein [Terriglobus albidus]|uniref:HvfC/BufC N-terminal domain-containing protein n=1 Tax=Terriglobus albidus TaxID=1592106 RepID=UPI0021E0C479|nr:putative DNA-binding domain-containing protein [Terriglobus albidus]